MPKDDKRTRAKKKRKAKQAKKALKWSEELERQYQAKWDVFKEMSPDIIELTPQEHGNIDLDVIPPSGDGGAYYGIYRDNNTGEPFPVLIYLRPMTIEEVEYFSNESFADKLREPMERGEVLAFRRFSDNKPSGNLEGLTILRRRDDEEPETSFLGQPAEPSAVTNKILGREDYEEAIQSAEQLTQELRRMRSIKEFFSPSSDT